MNIDVLGHAYSHPFGATATRPLARLGGRLALSFPLQGASALASADRYAGGLHAGRIPCFTLAGISLRRPHFAPDTRPNAPSGAFN